MYTFEKPDIESDFLVIVETLKYILVFERIKISLIERVLDELITSRLSSRDYLLLISYQCKGLLEEVESIIQTFTSIFF